MRKEIKIGLATAAILCIWLFGSFYLSGSFHLGDRRETIRAVTGLLGLVVLFSGVLFGIRRAQEENQEINYWTAFKTGLTISIIVAVVLSVVAGLHVLVYPQYTNDMIREAEASLKQSGLSSDEIDKKLASVKMEYSFGMQMIQPLLVQTIAGSLFSAILSFFFRTRK
jgi:hypothetical protein